MKRLSRFLIILGAALLVYGGWNIYSAQIGENESLQAAKVAIVEKKHLESASESEAKVTIEGKKRFNPPAGEAVGILAIERLGARLPIIEGTDPDELERGVGHFTGSYYPDESGQIVLSGHRDTVFRRAGELERGDVLELLLPTGQFMYKIIETKIVDADDRSVLTLQNEKEELILTTCYPFRLVGNAPQRYIIYAERLQK
ncbi:class D sortase [Bacillus lacus]|uniref:Class D sortase n=1 Tax=Metabacillus lacus TaxID=1983721 RepID=A0A7X2LXR4_9BACI|nr:class D sortase [Metabacillus lacus]MRX71571.1 class D sortase [Metabacillus lacus]